MAVSRTLIRQLDPESWMASPVPLPMNGVATTVAHAGVAANERPNHCLDWESWTAPSAVAAPFPTVGLTQADVGLVAAAPPSEAAAQMELKAKAALLYRPEAA